MNQRWGSAPISYCNIKTICIYPPHPNIMTALSRIGDKWFVHYEEMKISYGIQGPSFQQCWNLFTNMAFIKKWIPLQHPRGENCIRPKNIPAKQSISPRDKEKEGVEARRGRGRKRYRRGEFQPFKFCTGPPYSSEYFRWWSDLIIASWNHSWSYSQSCNISPSQTLLDCWICHKFFIIS